MNSVTLRVALGIALAALLGCGSSRDTFDGTDAGAGPPPPLGGDAACARHCGIGARTVLDCKEQVVETCPGEAACGQGGHCVTPCQGASDNKSSIGCDYWAENPDGWSVVPENPSPELGSSSGSCYAAFVVNTWDTPVVISLEYAGQTLDATKAAYLPQGTGSAITYAPLPNGKLLPGEVAIVFLAQEGSSGPFKTVCPKGVNSAVTTDPAVHGTGFGAAFHLTTSAPVVAYDIYPYGGAASFISSATLLLPTSVWGTNYVAVSGYRGSDTIGFKRPMNVTMVATEDDTHVTWLPKVAVEGAIGVAGSALATPVTYHLDRGQSLQLSQVADLSGSAVQGDKPFGLWGGHYCMVIGDDGACDSAHQQIPPVVALGSEYVAVRYRNRGDAEESVPWRVVGTVDGTVLTYDPITPIGAPATLKSGQIAEFSSSAAFTVKTQGADHPIYVSAHMTGGETVMGGTNCEHPPCVLGLGDPESVGLVPPEQFMPSYVFFTDPTYDETNLVVIRVRAPDGAFKDVSLDCAGTLSGWQPLGARYEYTRVDLARGGKAVGACDNGRHTMKSDVPFGLTVWGFGALVSYAYPAGARVRGINTVVVPAAPH